MKELIIEVPSNIRWHIRRILIQSTNTLHRNNAITFKLDDNNENKIIISVPDEYSDITAEDLYKNITFQEFFNFNSRRNHDRIDLIKEQLNFLENKINPETFDDCTNKLDALSKLDNTPSKEDLTVTNKDVLLNTLNRNPNALKEDLLKIIIESYSCKPIRAEEYEEIIKNKIIDSEALVTKSVFADLVRNKMHILDSLVNPEIIKLLYEKELISLDLLLEYAIGLNNLDLAKFTFSKGEILNTNNEVVEGNMLSELSHDLAELLFKNIKNLSMSAVVYFRIFIKNGLLNSQKTQDSFGHFFSIEKLRLEYKPSNQLDSDFYVIKDVYDLYCAYLNSDDLSNLERDLLDPHKDVAIEQIQNDEISNKWGYSALHLAFLGHKFDLAIQLIESVEDLCKHNKHGNSMIDIFRNVDSFIRYSEGMSKLESIIFSNLKEVDIVNNNGYSLVDFFIYNDYERIKKISELSNDPLLTLHKNKANIDEIFSDNKTHIGISYTDDSWSNGIWSTARLLMKNYPDVVFHLIDLDIIDNYDGDLLSKFDAFINPGSPDEYPENAFNLEGFKNQSSLSRLYQKVLNKANELDTPTLGLCGGAQHLVLNKNGTIEPIDGYDSGEHEISYVVGSPSYYMALTREQRKNMLDKGEFPEIKFKGITRHYYAADPESIDDITLGAVSEDNIPMAYSALNTNNIPIHFATQFHPELCYSKKETEDENYKNQVAFLDNFIELACINHNPEINVATHISGEMSKMSDMISGTDYDSA